MIAININCSEEFAAANEGIDFLIGHSRGQGQFELSTPFVPNIVRH